MSNGSTWHRANSYVDCTTKTPTPDGAWLGLTSAASLNDVCLPAWVGVLVAVGPDRRDGPTPWTWPASASCVRISADSGNHGRRTAITFATPCGQRDIRATPGTRRPGNDRSRALRRRAYVLALLPRPGWSTACAQTGSRDRGTSFLPSRRRG